MNHAQPLLRPTWHRVLQTGAQTAIGLTFAYALAFALYAIVRALPAIWITTPAENHLFGTLVANIASITLASLASALLLAPFTMLLGMATAALIEWLFILFNRQFDSRRALFIGLGAAAGFVFLLQLAVQLTIGQPLYNLSVETYIFWLGLPGLIHIGAGVVGAWFLNRATVSKEVS
ncbi:MAG: hypothetical protein IT328_07800 [Caldilineaceae bacterium]|nr:hypothetical protein [Caldilineaceae bacterium]